MNQTVARQDPAPPAEDPPGLGRTIVIGSAIGVVLCLVGVGVGMLAYGQVWQSALGLAVFIAFWGGIGFGSMMGGVIWAIRADQAAHTS